MNNLDSPTKICRKCNIKKLNSEFSKDKIRKEGLSDKCKSCVKEYNIAYLKTFGGLITDIYSSQKSSSKKRRHNPPNYTKKELAIWIKSQPNFQELWDNWVKSGYKKDLIPSCDRTNDYKSYCLTRLELKTWQENKDKGHQDRKNGVNNKRSKAVIGTHLKTGEVVVFHSTMEASRQLGIHNTSISKVALGGRKKDSNGYWFTRSSAGGYKWQFVT
ncbi:MAG: hypothetical protein QM499_00910 [Flavobacteriaceae bacterium]